MRHNRTLISKSPANRHTHVLKPHRGSSGDIAVFAPRFVAGRLEGFEKDMTICLRPLKRRGSLTTHAYLPALAACCAFVEYLTGLYRGRFGGIGWQQIAEFANRYLPKPDYDEEAIRVLFSMFRHPIAHRGIASGIWVDRNDGPGKGRRVTWQVSADARRPACEVVPKSGQLISDPPWPCTYTHLGHIHLRSLWVDLRNAANRYSDDVAADAQLQTRFVRCMKDLYPA